MSASFNCQCDERKKPVTARNWEVLTRECNYSAFNGYRYNLKTLQSEDGRASLVLDLETLRKIADILGVKQ